MQTLAASGRVGPGSGSMPGNASGVGDPASSGSRGCPTKGERFMTVVRHQQPVVEVYVVAWMGAPTAGAVPSSGRH